MADQQRLSADAAPLPRRKAPLSSSPVMPANAPLASAAPVPAPTTPAAPDRHPSSASPSQPVPSTPLPAYPRVEQVDARPSPAGKMPFEEDEVPLFIGVAGGTASGKTTVCSRIIQKLHDDGIIRPDQNVVVVCQDSFYKPLNAEQSALAHRQAFNFDEPSAFDFPLLQMVIQKLLRREPVDIPVYNFVTHSRHPTAHIHIEKADVIILEGILALFDECLVNLMNMKLFVEADSDERLARRIARDTVERGRELTGIINQYLTFVKPAYERFILPTKQVADIVIQKGGDNMVAVNLICGHIRQALDKLRLRRQQGRRPSPPAMGVSPVILNPLSALS